MQNQISLSDILANYGESYISQRHIQGQEKGIIRLLASCRSSALGSHYEKCDHCDYVTKAYNSCRNRHCPVCQQKDKQEWLEKRLNELLPVGYYHLVFTIPHHLNDLCLHNKKVMYDILFKAASETILQLTKDTKHMGAHTGLISVLHTWGQNLNEHPHLHCIMPAGGLSFDKSHWVDVQHKGNFFIHYKVLSRKFRGKFLDFMHQAYEKGHLKCKGKSSALATLKNFTRLKQNLIKKEWIVHIQPPFGSAKKVLEYLSRYVFRVAITNSRLIEIKDGKVHFFWKDYRTGLFRKMNLEINEFIRRFLLHLLPKGFFKVRYYGIYSNRFRKQNIEKANQLLLEQQQVKQQEDFEDGLVTWQRQLTIWDEILKLIEAYKKPNCPICKKGILRFAGQVPVENYVPG
jgi:hypothetical protein